MAQFEVEVEILRGLAAALDAVGRLTARLEAGRPNTWTPEEMGVRHQRLAQGVVAFRARVLTTNAKFTLGQNERDDVLEDILAGLDGSRETDLASAMRLANRHRNPNLAKLQDPPGERRQIQTQGSECGASAPPPVCGSTS